MINHLGLYSNVTPNLSVKQGLIMSQKVGFILGGFYDIQQPSELPKCLIKILWLGKTIVLIHTQKKDIFTNPEIQDARDLSISHVINHNQQIFNQSYSHTVVTRATSNYRFSSGDLNVSL